MGVYLDDLDVGLEPNALIKYHWPGEIGSILQFSDATTVWIIFPRLPKTHTFLYVPLCKGHILDP